MTDFLIGDIGGTNARLALACHKSFAIRSLKTFSSGEFGDFQQVVAKYLADLPSHESIPERACFAVASPVVGDWIKFTNNPWSFSITELGRQLPLKEVKIINDFVAVALSLPYLQHSDLTAVGSGKIDTRQTLGVMGPGTGLGMAVLIPAGKLKIPMATEGGHAGWSPTDIYEMEIWKILQETREIVCREDLLSGQGLVNLATAIGTIDGLQNQGLLRPEDITKSAIDDENSHAQKVLDYFCAILGSTAGDFALQTGARGGIFIAGGIIPRMEQFFLNSRFREKFEAKGRFRKYVGEVPSVLVSSGQPGLVGAAAALHN